MHPLRELRKIINSTSPNRGKLVAINEGRELRIATNQGVTSILKQPGDVTNYKVGDSLILSNGRVVGRRLTQPTVYVL